MSEFCPPPLLRNPHVQSILASTSPRKIRLRGRTRALLSASNVVVLDCGDGVQLLGEYSQQATRSKGLVILIHGWEGSSKSTYMLSAGSTLYNAGFDVFRLNLRDHGPSHHLNRELFNSTRLNEVVSAVARIQEIYPHDWNFLAGFSLGGNFALRVSTKASDAGLKLHKTVAICPVLDPVRTMHALEEGWWVYEKYFVRKWKRSLRKKLELYPDLGYQNELGDFKTLRGMNEYFVPNHTSFASTRDYLNAYAITGDALGGLSTPAHIIAAGDDPIILADDLVHLANSPYLKIETPQFGGHCGFVANYRLDSWVDGRLLELINDARTTARMEHQKAVSEPQLLGDGQHS